jgi:hypothetical protein
LYLERLRTIRAVATTERAIAPAIVLAKILPSSALLKIMEPALASSEKKYGIYEIASY